MGANTKVNNEIFVDDEFLGELVNLERTKRIDKLLKDLNIRFDFLLKNNWEKISNKNFYYISTYNFFIVDSTRKCCKRNGIAKQVDNISVVPLNFNEAQDLFLDRKSSNPLVTGNDIININDTNSNSIFFRIACLNGTSPYILDIDDNSSCYSEFSNMDSIKIPVARIQFGITTKEFILKNDLKFEALNDKETKKFDLLVQLYKDNKIVFTNNNIELSDDYKKAVLNNKIDSFLDISFKKEDIISDLKSAPIDLTDETKALFTNKFLICDTDRAHIEPYDIKRLEDPNLGHWDLWKTEGSKGETKIKINSSFIGRNPLADIKEDGIIGIDFGTKSTIVVYQSGDDMTQPMRVGSGDFNKSVEAKDFENPTVMEFINIDDFIDRYNKKAGRPKTLWDDMTISHTALNSLLSVNIKSDEYYSFFSDLKQWSSDKNRQIIIRDKNNVEKTLPAFVDIEDGNFNPIELYAYYLGLFINNMYNGIYMNYMLSFPVTYEREIRGKIIESFEKGIKKSLPTEVLEDEETMKGFRILQGASEPAAYAVCALQQYGFEPENNEKVFYGIFDFGGGTTDFDFGIWRSASEKEKRFDYVIKHFGAGGDRYLGGENLLEMLAFEVFKANEKTLREQHIRFYKPAECATFAGSEVLLSESQEAKLNLKQLMEELRPLWEKHTDYKKKYENNSVKLTLFDKAGQPISGVTLDVTMEDLNSLIRTRIEKGVKNFFEALSSVLTEDIAKEVSEIVVFLAGNSSKAEVVTELFNEYTEKYSNALKSKFNFKTKEAKKNKSIKTIYKEDFEDTQFEDFEKDYLAISDSFSTDDLENYSFIKKVIENNADDFICDWLSTEDIAYAIEDGFIGKAEIEKLKKWEDEFDYEELSNALKNYYKANSIFHLYPALGTPEAIELQKSLNLDVDENDLTRPTGKTGVAYGLIECRPGSRIKVESEIKSTDEIKFNYYLGQNIRKKFNVVIGRDVEYKKWIEFIDSTENDFEIYFTDLPEAATNSLPIKGINKKMCRIDETHNDSFVYIRAVEPSVIEYVAALPEEIEEGKYISDVKQVKLG